MNIKKVLGVGALLCVFALNFSCETESISETNDLQGIEKDEIKEEDT